MSSQVRSTSCGILCMSTCYNHAEAPGAGFCVPADMPGLSISAAALAPSTQKPTTEKNPTSPICGCWVTQRGLVGEAEAVPCPDRHRGQTQLVSGKRQIEVPPEHSLHLALFVCICFLDWDSAGVSFPPSFQRADHGPGSRALAPLAASEHAVSDS